jgi:hypothetical protein
VSPTIGYLFDDNPAEQDLIGLESVAKTIADVLRDGRPDPLTIGVNSPWGGGKSTTLHLIEKNLADEESIVVVLIDPWEFVDSGDPRGTLISRVLDGIENEVTRRANVAPDEDGTRERLLEVAREVGDKLNDLRRRISWSRVAQVALKSAITLSPDIPALVEAFTPKAAPKPEAKGMKEFRGDFTALLQSISDVKRVVVLVDDLDRCLPEDVLGAFEAIKLFLSVKGMAFVLAADDSFIRESLREALNRNGRGTLADRYTEKVIQLPFTLPRLSKGDATAYIATLLAYAETDEHIAHAISLKVAQRRAAGNAPYVIAGMHEGLPTDDHVRRAESIVNGMSSTQMETPRQIKRFLNNYAIRANVLTALIADFPETLLIKLWILEQNHLPRFLRLARLSEAERTELLELWENSSDAEYSDISAWATNGEKVSEQPSRLTSYLTFATSVLTDVTVGGVLSSTQADLLSRLIDDSEVVRRAAQTEMQTPTAGDPLVALQLAAAVVGEHSEGALDSVSRVATYRPDLVEEMRTALLQGHIIALLGAEHLPWLGPSFPDVLQTLRAARFGDEALVEAIDDELSGD